MPTKTKPKSTKPKKPPKVTGPILTLREAAEYLRVAENEVSRLAEQGGIPARRLGSEWRFLQRAIDDWLRIAAPEPSKRGSFDAIMKHVGIFKDEEYKEEFLALLDSYRGPRPSDDLIDQGGDVSAPSPESLKNRGSGANE